MFCSCRPAGPGGSGHILAFLRQTPMHGVERMRLFRALALVAGAFILLVHAAGATGVSPCAVVDSYERARSHSDFKGALAQLDDGAVVTVHDPRARSLATRQQITEFLQYTTIR